MRKKKGIRLRSAVNALVLLAVAATVTISSYVAYRSETESLTRMTYRLSEAYSGKIADTVNGLFLDMKKSLKVYGDFLAQDLSRDDLHEQLELFQKGNSSFNAVFIILKDGRMLDATNATRKSAGQVIHSPGTDQALQERRPLVSEPYVSVTTNKLIVMVSQPLYGKNGDYLGFIGGSIRLHETNIFQTVLGSAPIATDGSYAYVVSSQGVLLYHPDSTRIGEKVQGNPVIERLKAGESGKDRIFNSKGVDMLATFAYIEEAKWGIVSQTPAEIVHASAGKLVRKIALYMLPALLLFIVLIYAIVRKLSEPFSRLAEFASKLSPTNSGADVLPSIHGMNYEANELHKAFGRAVRHFRYQFDNLSQEAQTDPLTGLYNRRTMDRFVAGWIAKSEPFSFILLDLDHFKQVNDTFGHDVGDDVLKFLADAMKRLSGPDLPCCRLGGEEFVVLAPDESFEQAMRRAERIRAYMSETDSPTGGKITLSVGVAQFPGFGNTSEQLFRAADEALYRAKKQGRNRVEPAQLAAAGAEAN